MSQEQEILDILREDLYINELGEACIVPNAKNTIAAMICTTMNTMPDHSNIHPECGNGAALCQLPVLATSQVDFPPQQLYQTVDEMPYTPVNDDFNFMEDLDNMTEMWLDSDKEAADRSMFSLSWQLLDSSLVLGNDPMLPVCGSQQCLGDQAADSRRLGEGDFNILDFLCNSGYEANFEELNNQEQLAFVDNHEQVAPMPESDETPKTYGSSAGSWVIDLGAQQTLENTPPVVGQAASALTSTDDSMSTISSSVSKGASKRPHSTDSDDDVQSLTTSSSNEPEASTPKLKNRLASKRCRVNKKSREDFNEQEVKRLEERNNFLIRKTAMMEAVRDKIRALVASRVTK